MPLNKTTFAIFLTALIALTVSWYLWKPAPPVPETPAPAQRQQDGSLILERKPMPAFKPRHIIPRGAKLEREMSVTVKPKARPFDNKTSCPPCPPVTVDMSLVKMPDNTRRVIASSPDGDVVGGLDIPIEPGKPPDEKKWAVGLTASVTSGMGFGVFVDRDMGPFRVGAEVNNIYSTNQGVRLGGIQAVIKAGIRF